VAQVVEAHDGRQLAVKSLGDPVGRPVFLLHGTPGTLDGPLPRGIFLYRLGIRLISYTRPGYPGSDRHENRTVADAAADVEAIADKLGLGRFSVIGRSGGAPHALACAAAKPLRDRVVCTAALSSLAPYDAHGNGLDWFAGMADSNIEAYRNATSFHKMADSESGLQSLIATFNEHARQVRNNSQGLLNTLWPELVESDRRIIGDVALRRIIARAHAEAVRDSIDGWLDDVMALGSPWGFELSDITSPVLLWHGVDDKQSPASHAKWLAKKIPTADLDLNPGVAHFGAVEILPETLSWVLRQVSAPAPIEAPVAPPPVYSERLRGDYAEQSAGSAGGGDVGMIGAEHRP
jgi:pimeloyl-ACP methyl ester carboxylesterase